MPEAAWAKPARDKVARMRVALDKIDALLLRLGQQGLQRMTRSSLVELRALSQTAHNAALVRIERQVETLAAQVERYLDKDPVFSMGDYVGTVNRVWLLARSARRAVEAGHHPDDMLDVLGEARRSYVAVEGPLSLQPLGAAGWVTDTGFVGVTVYFHAPSHGILQASNTKPSAYFGTDPRRLMRMPISEHVPLSIHEVAHGAYVLTGAKVSSDGRLSLHRELRTAAAPYTGGRAYREVAARRWTQLTARLRERELDPVGGSGPVLALAQAKSYGDVVLDERAARCTAEVTDGAGGRLQLEVPLRPENNFLIDNLERCLGAAGRRNDLLPDALFGRVWIAGGRLSMFPLTAIYESPVVDRRTQERLHEVHLALEDLRRVSRRA